MKPIIQEQIRIRGTVQGVGLRPTAYRLACARALDGEIFNDTEGVCIRVAGLAAAIDDFVHCLQVEAPPLARIETIERQPFMGTLPSGFRIAASQSGEAHTAITADAATCAQCLADVQNPHNRRYGYAFTNCTHCGPRLSIVLATPYDRQHTSMADFAMCSDCEREYRDPTDRRFHAQPNACPACGPQIWLERYDGDRFMRCTADNVFAYIKECLLRGDILGIKGLGGFHLACDAGNEQAVTRLRERKHRYEKPFALMARDLTMIRRYCQPDRTERTLLQSVEAPIVIMACSGPEKLAAAVAPGQNHYGFMLPYTPLHYLTMAELDRPIVLTSGNRSEEPQCIDNDEAREKLSTLADVLVLHDRAIVNRVDDSVVRVISKQPRLLRRARGYAPTAIRLPQGFANTPKVLALGGELKNTFCLLSDGQAVLSQHLGDLENLAAHTAYRDTLELYQQLFNHKPEQLAADLHPEYLSSKFAKEYAAQNGLPIIEVQHHHAHIAACMADNGIPRAAPPVLGVALDGLGFGTDGALWGGEFLLADYLGFERLACFKPMPMPGAAQAIREPWRMALAYLTDSFDWMELADKYADLAFFQYVQSKPVAALLRMMEKGVHCPLTSSCGRLFDAASSLLGLCHSVSYEGQAAIALEAIVDVNTLLEQADDERYTAMLRRPHNAATEIETRGLWQALLHDISRGIAPSVIAARFHRAMAKIVVTVIQTLAEQTGNAWQSRVVLSGGVFQNAILLEQLEARLQTAGYTVYTHRQVPANDGGLALGQAVIAAASNARDEA